MAHEFSVRSASRYSRATFSECVSGGPGRLYMNCAAAPRNALFMAPSVPEGAAGLKGAVCERGMSALR